MTADPPRRSPVLLARAFRVFFLLAGLHALLFMALWVASLALSSGVGVLPEPAATHAHGMLFGYVPAVVAGFLLTAAENWSASVTARGSFLGALAGLWLLAQLALLASPPLPPVVLPLLELTFLAALGAAIVPPLARAGDRNARFVAAVLSLLAVAAVLAGLERVAAVPGGTGNRVALYVYLVLITVIGGRVIPFFTARALPGTTVLPRLRFDLSIAGAIVVTAVLQLFGAPAALVGTAALAASAIAAVRALSWLRPGVHRQALLWVLHAGNAWLVLGLLLLGLAELGMTWRALAVHALTAGAIGTLTLGMMARVTLGHTGRALRAGKWLTTAFVLVSAAAVLRVLVPMAVPQGYLALAFAADVSWMAAFAVFLGVQGPMLVRPRVDGQPG